MIPLYAPDKLQFFAALVQRDDDIVLFEAALAIAQDAQTAIDLSATQSSIDALSKRLEQRLPPDASALSRLRALLAYFYQELGFAANLNNYYDPENSYLHRVLANRRGIPISLALILMEMAQQIGLSLEGISFPGHFLLKMRVDNGEVILDPLTGSSLSRDELEQLLIPHLQARRQGDLAADNPTTEIPDKKLQHYLQSSSPRQILIRMLRNLKSIFVSQEDWPQLLPVLQRLAILEPDNLTAIRDRGLAYANLDCPQAALSDLEQYLAARPGAFDAELLKLRLPQLREAAKRLN